MRSATTDGPSTPPAAAAAKPSYGGTATLLYTLTDGSSYAEATALFRTGNSLYAAGYYMDGLRGRGRGLEKRAGIFRPLRRTGSSDCP